jgi:hypothetical protein
MRLFRGVYNAAITLTAFAIGLGCALGWFDAGPDGDSVRSKSQSWGPNGSRSAADGASGQFLSADHPVRPRQSVSMASWRGDSRPSPTVIAEHIRAVMALPPPEREAAMDKDIELMQQIAEQLKKQREEAKASAGDSKQAEDGRESAIAAAGSTSIHAGRNRMLSSIPAEQRACANNNRQLFQAYQALLQGRAAERGITLPTFGPPH